MDPKNYWRSLLLVLVVLAPYFPALGGEEGVAKVIIIRGVANIMAKDGTSSPLKQEQWLKEGAKVKTEKGGFARLLFIDKSTINVGPDSEMEITSFPKTEAGVLTVIEGNIRSQVTKNYMEIQDKDKSKLFIKTKTAAMGVRGTDFIVGYDKTTGASSLDVISGIVAMGKLEDHGTFDQNALEKIVSGDNAVLVEKGFQSEVAPESAKPNDPTKIPDNELNKLKTDDNTVVMENREERRGEEKREENSEEKKEETKEDKTASDERRPAEQTQSRGEENRTEENKDEEKTTRTETRDNPPFASEENKREPASINIEPAATNYLPATIDFVGKDGEDGQAFFEARDAIGDRNSISADLDNRDYRPTVPEVCSGDACHCYGLCSVDTSAGVDVNSAAATTTAERAAEATAEKITTSTTTTVNFIINAQ